MEPGKLRERIYILDRTVTRDPTTGQELETWVARMPFRWAAVRHLRGREFMDAQAVQSEVVAEIRTRYLTNITGENRVHWAGTNYEIEGEPIHDMSKTETRLMIKTSQNQDFSLNG